MKVIRTPNFWREIDWNLTDAEITKATNAAQPVVRYHRMTKGWRSPVRYSQFKKFVYETKSDERGAYAVFHCGNGDSLIDIDDLPLLQGRAPSITRKGYSTVCIDRKEMLIHRLVLPGFPLIDHADQNKSNNRRYNIRPASPLQNMGNRKPNSHGKTSRFKGVKKCKNSWEARITDKGRRITLGRRKSEEEAAMLYDQAAFKKWGEFACVNFPERLLKTPKNCETVI